MPIQTPYIKKEKCETTLEENKQWTKLTKKKTKKTRRMYITN